MNPETRGTCQERVGARNAVLDRGPICGRAATHAFNDTLKERTVETCWMHACRYENRVGWCEVPVPGNVVPLFPTEVAPDLAAAVNNPAPPPPPMKEDNRVDALLAELARHEQHRTEQHDQAGCARCRLLEYLAGRGPGHEQREHRPPFSRLVDA